MRHALIAAVLAVIAAAAVPADAAAAGDGVDTPGVVRPESGGWGWWLSNDFDAGVAHHLRFGPAGTTPLAGDWDGDGDDTAGVNIGGNHWVLGNANNGSVAHDFVYGNPGDVPLVGDWDGDGRDTIAIRRDHCFQFNNALDGSDPDTVTCFGNPTDKPVVGDWDGNGTDTPGVVRGGVWIVNNDFSGTVHAQVAFGNAGDQALPGDWDGDGDDSPGVRRNQWVYLSNDFSGATHRSLVFGNAGDVGVAGDWEVVGGGAPGGGGGGSGGGAGGGAPGTGDAGGFHEADVEGYIGGGGSAQSAMSTWAKYAPIVYFHPAEDAWPARATEHFIANSELVWSVHRGRDHKLTDFGETEPDRLGVKRFFSAYTYCGWFSWQLTRPYRGDRPAPPTGGCALRSRDGFFLNLRDRRHEGQRRLRDAIVYYEFPRERGGHIVYWFFYAFNKTRWHGIDRSRFDHEGDWERVVVNLNDANRATGVAYYRHGCEPVKVPWRRVPRVNDGGRRTGRGTHPVVYSALGRHGSYAQPGDGNRHHCESRIVGDDRVAGSDRQWRTWRRMARVDRQPWFGYGGAWGEVGCKQGAACDTFLAEHGTGPLGPYPGKQGVPAGW